MQQTKPDENQPKQIIGPDGCERPVRPGLILGIERFNQPGHKHYRLIWIDGGEAWLCEEDTTHYRRKFSNGERVGAFEAGQALAEKYGSRFSGVTQ